MKIASSSRMAWRMPYSMRKHIGRGFTLLELSLTMVSGTLAGAMMLALFNQQVSFLQMYRTQNFLMEEAPIISVYVNRIISGADSFSVHGSLNDGWFNINPQTEGSSARFNFQQPDGSTRATILSFQDLGEGSQLYYYVMPLVAEGGPIPPLPVDEPEWSVTNSAANVEFVIEDGILQIIITGQAGEEIIYSGSMQP